jgi:GNAT superfamily N-acetyltransferase
MAPQPGVPATHLSVPTAGRVHLGHLCGARRAQQRSLRRMLVHRLPPGVRPEGISHRAVKDDRVRTDRVHAALALDEDGAAQGWCQYGSREELPGIKHRREYDKDAPPRPDWRITCLFVDRKHRGQGIARAALAGALDQIAHAGGVKGAISWFGPPAASARCGGKLGLGSRCRRRRWWSGPLSAGGGSGLVVRAEWLAVGSVRPPCLLLCRFGFRRRADIRR